MKWRVVAVLCLVLALSFGGLVFAQTHLTFKGVNYASSMLKPLPIDKDHVVLVGEQMGIETNNQPALNNMSTHFSVIVYFANGVSHWHGYGVFADKDGDTILSEIWDNPAVVNGGKTKILGGTGKFAGTEGT